MVCGMIIGNKFMITGKKSVLSVFFSAAIATWVACSSSIYAVSPAVANNIAVISIEELVKSSKAFKLLQDDYKHDLEQLQKAFAAQEEKLKREEEEVMSQKDLLTEEEYIAKMKNISKEAQQLQREKKDRAARISLPHDKKGEIFWKKLFEVIKKFGEEHDIGVIIPQAVYTKEGFDITKEVLERVDEEMPYIFLEDADQKDVKQENADQKEW